MNASNEKIRVGNLGRLGGLAELKHGAIANLAVHFLASLNRSLHQPLDGASANKYEITTNSSTGIHRIIKITHTESNAHLNNGVDVDVVLTLDLMGLQTMRALHAVQR